MEEIAQRLMQIPGVVAVTLGGSRATGTATDESDWDFGLYYRGSIDPADIEALGWPGQVFEPGAWGRVVNGGAWLEVEGVDVDLIYRDIDQVLHWTAEARQGRFQVEREVGYVAGIATYVLVGELAVGRLLGGELLRPAFPERLRDTAPVFWRHLAAGALHFAEVHARRGDGVATSANIGQALLATAQAELAARGQWALNEKGIVSRAGLTDAAHLAEGGDPEVVVPALRQILRLPNWGR